MHVLDRIERKVLLNASRKQVWEALTDAEQFGRWFGIALEGKVFVAGETIEAPITYPGYEHVIWKARIERILPQTLFSFWWHPFAVEVGVDYDQEPPRWWNSPLKTVHRAFCCGWSSPALTRCPEPVGRRPSR